MFASAGDLPHATSSADWAFEMKWDGLRAITYVDDNVRIMTRNDLDVTVSYPELTVLGRELQKQRLVLDGEIVAIDDQARPNFGLLQQRMHIKDPARATKLATSVPLHYFVFDLLYVNGEVLIDKSYDERRDALESLDLDDVTRWQLPPALYGDSERAMAVSQGSGLEGVVAKLRTSKYVPGRRVNFWIKAKHIRTQEVVIVGWRPGKGYRSSTLGSLLLAIPDDDGLKYVGRVGTGFDTAALDALTETLRLDVTSTPAVTNSVPAADARDAVWVQPRLVGEVAFTEFTADGRLRHPTWRGLRPDKSPQDVRLER